MKTIEGGMRKLSEEITSFPRALKFFRKLKWKKVAIENQKLNKE
jgi:hypothetical protein